MFHRAVSSLTKIAATRPPVSFTRRIGGLDTDLDSLIAAIYIK